MIKALAYNKGTHFTNVKFDGSLAFLKIDDVYKQSPDSVYVLNGLFINTKSKYGARPYLATPDFFMDLPSHMLETVEAMIADPDVVGEINGGKVGFQIRTYQSKQFNRECYSIVFVELKV